MYEGSLMSIFEEHGIPDQDHEGKRRPLDGACPVCFAGFSPRDKTVWCQTGCGNNVHKACFEQWARTSRSSQGSVRCIYWFVSTLLLPIPPRIKREGKEEPPSKLTWNFSPAESNGRLLDPIPRSRNSARVGL